MNQGQRCAVDGSRDSLRPCLGLVADGAPRMLVIGPRQATEAELAMAARLGQTIAALGGVAVWRGMVGVEQTAATACLAAGGRSVLVLDRGTDHVNPAIASWAAQVRSAGGAVVGPFPSNRRFGRGQVRIALHWTLGWVDGVAAIGGVAGSGTARALVAAWRHGARLAIVGPTTPWLAQAIVAGGLTSVSEPEEFASWWRDVQATPDRGRPRGPVPSELLPPTGRRRHRPPPGLQSAGATVQPVRARASDPGPDAPLPERLRFLLECAEPDGRTLEALAAGLDADRGEVATLALACAMQGTVRRLPGGLWRAA